MRVELFPYQIEGAKFLAERGRALLADEMGLGKSAQAIAACDRIGYNLFVAVVCPASVRENWGREFRRFSRGDHAVGVQSYDAVARGAWNDVRDLDVLILDEAHYLKNHKAKRTKAIFGDKCDGAGGLVSKAKNVFLLTGTPTPNHPGELWPLLRAVMPQAIAQEYKTPPNVIKDFRGDDFLDVKGGRIISLRPLSYWSFVQKYCRTRDNGFGIQIVGGKNLDQLKANIAPYVLRRKKEEVLKDLPPIRFDELPLTGELKLPPDVIDQTWAVQKVLDEKGIDGLREIAPHVAQLRRLTGLAKVPAVIEWIMEQFEGGLKKLVVFAQHRDVIEAIDEATRDLFGAWCVHGGTPSHVRQTAVDAFQTNDDIRLFIGQIQAAGTGITLTAASDLLFVESSWVPAENEQAAMRIHRIGQRNACLVRFATLAGSIDEQIQRAVMRKTTDIAKLFG